MSNVLSTPKLLICPGDKARVAAKNWQEFGPANVSYEFLNPGGSETNPYVLLTRCPIHGNVGLSDGSAWMGSGLGSSFTISVQDGKQVFTPLNQPANSSPSEVLRQRYGLPPNTNVVPPARATDVDYE